MNENQRNQMREEMIHRLMSRSRKDSLTTMRAEDMAKYMNVSKVTMYKYFSSKDEILAMIVSIVANYLRNEEIPSTHESGAIIEGYQKSFEHSLMTTYYFPERFFHDFKAYNQSLYEKIVDAQQYRLKQLDELYRLGAEQGVFYPVNSAILILEDKLILGRILEPSFLIQHGLSLEQALIDYYEMQKRTLIYPKYLNNMDDSPVEEAIRHFIIKNSRNL